MSKSTFTFEDITYLDGAIRVYNHVAPAADVPSLRYPTHFARDPLVQDRSPFDPAALYDVIRILTPRPPGVPLDPDLVDLAPNLEEHRTIAHLEGYFRKLREIYGQGRVKKNMFSNPNIVDREDWYTDDVFGQQQFTGVNPTTISAVGKWFEIFQTAAGNNETLKKFLEDNKDNLYVQDYSYFRDVVGVPKDDLTSGKASPSDPLPRYLCAPVALFHQEMTIQSSTGPSTCRLYPVAIIIDWKGTLDESVSIFNPSLTNQKPESWPWRYAKTCVSVADWIRHQVEIHLVGHHFVEEGIMVGVTRTLPRTHPIRRLLEPHWNGTRPVNIGARRILVPGVVAPIVGLDVVKLFKFLNNAFTNYDFKSRYIPADLRARGFPDKEENLETKFSNYGYARNALPMWGILCRFVTHVLESYYKADANGSMDQKVERDQDLQSFCREVAVEIKLGGFPQKIETFNDLADMVTMCIFIPTVGHAAINYLQEYYLVFVPNRPAALYTPLPKSSQELLEYEEGHLINALPAKATTHWLIAAQLSYLLSFRPPDDFTLFAYAERESKGRIKNSLWPDAGQPTTDGDLKQAAIELKRSLEAFGVESRRISLQVGNTAPRYGVLDPELATSSIIL